MVTDNNSMLTRQKTIKRLCSDSIESSKYERVKTGQNAAAALRQGEQQRRQDRENNSNSKVETTVATVRSGILDLVIALVKCLAMGCSLPHNIALNITEKLIAIPSVAAAAQLR